MRRNTKIHLYHQGSSTEGSARATAADEAHLFQKDQTTTQEVCIVNIACQGYSFSSVWTPPTIFNTRLALPHLGGGKSIITFCKDCVKDHPTRSILLLCATDTLLHNCTIFMWSLDVGNMDDQCKGPSIKGKDHLAGQLPTHLQFAGGTVGALVGWAPAPGQELAQSP